MNPLEMCHRLWPTLSFYALEQSTLGQISILMQFFFVTKSGAMPKGVEWSF